MRIAIDVDDTIAVFGSAFTKFLREKHDIRLRVDEMREYNTEKILGITKDRLTEYFLEMEKVGVIAELKAVINATHYIKKLRKEGHEIIILTSRIFSNKVTFKWLADNNIEYDKFYRRFGDKSSINYDILVDDNPKHIMACEEKRVYSIVVSHPWNQSMSVRGMKFCRRADNWHHIYRIINEIGVGKRGF